MPTKIQPAVVYDADGIALKGAHEVLVENCLVERCDLLGEPFLSFLQMLAVESAAALAEVYHLQDSGHCLCSSLA